MYRRCASKDALIDELLRLALEEVMAGTERALARTDGLGLEELTVRAAAAGTVNPGTTPGDALALIWAIRGLVQATGETAPGAWQRFPEVQLAGLRAGVPLSSTPPLSSRQLSKLAPRRRS